MTVFIVGLSLFCLFATIVPFFKWGHWTVRMFDFPHVQLTILTLVALLLLILLVPLQTSLYVLLLGSLIIALMYQVYILYPYTPIAPTQVLKSREIDKSNSIKLLSSNVLIDNREAEKLKQVIKENDPDIIALLEPNDWWAKQMEELEKTYPYVIHEPRDNTYGILLYSRLELIEPKIHYLIRDDIPSIITRVRLRSGQIIHLYCLHPEPPTPEYGTLSDERDAELLLVGKEYIDQTQPTIVFGDLNDVAWSRTTRLFQKTSGLLDPRIGRGTFNTFHADYRLLRWPLDHIFHSNHFLLNEIKRLPHVGSDHFPMYIELQYKNEAEILQERPDTTFEEQKEAEEIIDKVETLEEDRKIG